MAERKHGKPYVWVTHVTGLLAGDDNCHWAPWFKSRYTYDKDEDDFDALTWRQKHTAMAEARARELKADGWQVTMEGQNSMTIRGKTCTVGCKPDIVAIKTAERRILISDQKGGKKKDAHWWQVVIYMRWIRDHLGPEFATYSVEGELDYGPGDRKPITWEDVTPTVLSRIYQELQAIGLNMPPEKAPSESECKFCDIPKAECPEKAATRRPPVEELNF